MFALGSTTGIKISVEIVFDSNADIKIICVHILFLLHFKHFLQCIWSQSRQNLYKWKKVSLCKYLVRDKCLYMRCLCVCMFWRHSFVSYVLLFDHRLSMWYHSQFPRCLSRYFSLFCFLLSSICIRRKYWIRENFQHRVFDGFTCFQTSWTGFDHF